MEKINQMPFESTTRPAWTANDLHAYRHKHGYCDIKIDHYTLACNQIELEIKPKARTARKKRKRKRTTRAARKKKRLLIDVNRLDIAEKVKI
tara:strand:- start:743 stop:1018 length:276 start_codon:yes stop_codon:yes gene_type:complete